MSPTRLDTLITLLHDGTSTVVREFAAEKLAQIATSSPHFIPLLLDKLRSLLFHSEWDTRVAVASALGKISIGVGTKWMTSCATTAIGVEASSKTTYLNFSTVDVAKVLLNASPLLKSGGDEYVYQHNLGKEELKRYRNKQRRILLDRISAVTELWDEQDAPEAEYAKEMLPRMSMRSMKQIENELEQDPNIPLQDTATKANIDENKAQMSIREISNLQRKRSLEVKQDSDSKKIKVESKSAECDDRTVFEAIGNLYIDLFESLFDASWIIRHGSAMALREMLRSIHGDVKADHSLQLGSSDHSHTKLWVEECVVRCLCVLALDQYADFSLEQTVAPVREIVGQIYGLLLSFLDTEHILLGITCTKSLVKHSEWHAQHGGFVGLKYLLIAANKRQAQLVPYVFTSVEQALNNEVEEVQAIAASIIIAISRHLNVIEIEVVRRTFSNLQRVVENEDTSADALRESVEALVAVVEYAYHANAPELDLSELFRDKMRQRLYHLLHHGSSAVRKSAMRALDLGFQSFFCVKREEAPQQLGIFLSQLIPGLLGAGTEEEKRQISLTWMNLLKNADREILRKSTSENTFLAWVDAIPLVDLRERNICLMKIYDQRSCCHHIRTDRDTSDAPISLFRDNLLRLVVDFIVAISANSALATSLMQKLLSWINSSSGIKITVAGVILSAWAKRHTEESSKASFLKQMQSDISQALLNRISSLSVSRDGKNESLFAEQSALLQRVIGSKNCLLQIFKHEKLAVDFVDPIGALTMASRSRKIAEQVSSFPYMSLSGLQFHEATDKRQSLFSFDEDLHAQFNLMLMRSKSALAMGYFDIMQEDLPKKINPFIQALMQCLKEEPNQCYRIYVADCISRFISSQGLSRRKCVNKIICNLCSSICAVNDKDDIPHLELPLQYRVLGAEEALKRIVQHLGTRAFKVVACLETSVGLEQEFKAPEEINRASRLIQLLTPVMNVDLQMLLLPLIQVFRDACCLHKGQPAVLTAGAKAISAICVAQTTQAMQVTYPRVFRCLVQLNQDDTQLHEGKLIAASTLFQITTDLSEQRLVRYIPSLIHYAMATMADQNQDVQRLGSICFSRLVPLMGLEMDLIPDSADKSPVIRQNAVSREFLDQLLHGKAIVQQDVSSVLSPSFKLRQYQQHGLDWLVFLQKSRLNGILADDMGLGKSIQILAALALLYHEKTLKQDKSLILCPSTLVQHWEDEIDRFFPTILHGIDGPSFFSKRASQAEANIIITSYSHFRANRASFHKHTFLYCVLDEGHVIRNPSTKLSEAVRMLRCKHRAILSGTPIQNNVCDIWSLFDFLMPGYFGEYAKFQKEYENPILKAQNRNTTAELRQQGSMAMEKLHSKIVPFVLRRTKAEVLTDLPPKIIQNRYCNLTSLQESIYARIRQMQCASSSVFRSLQLLRKVSVHPKLICSSSSLENKHLDFGEEKKVELPADVNDVKYSGKLMALKELLLECGITAAAENADVCSPHRCLIFAQMKDTLSLVEQLLQKHLPSATYLRMDGSVPSNQRYSIATRFNSDPSIDLLLLSTSVGGLGLTLTGADTVIFLEHSWNPFVDMQAMDRAHRIGQRRTVNVYRIVSHGCLDEHIMDLQSFKADVANTVVQDIKPDEQLNTHQVLQLLQDSSDRIHQNFRNKHASKDESKDHLSGLPQAVEAMLSEMDNAWDPKQYESLHLHMPSSSG